MTDASIKLLPTEIVAAQRNNNHDISHSEQNNDETESESEWCNCKGWWSYVKVTILAIIACGTVSGIYSFLVNVETIYPWPDGNFPFTADSKIVNGVSCGYDYFGSTSQNTCDELATILGNDNITINGSHYNLDSNNTHSCIKKNYNNLSYDTSNWMCNLTEYTDYTNSSLTSKVDDLLVYLVLLCVFAVLYGVFALIHDSAIIYKMTHDENPDEIIFFPKNYDSWTKKVLNKYSKKMQETNTRSCIVCCILECLFFLIYLVIFLLVGSVESLIVLLLRPFWHCYKHWPHFGFGFISISPIWVGVARLGMVMTASWLSLAVFVGFPMPISGYDGIAKIVGTSKHNCECSCNYYFGFKDSAKLYFVTVVLIILNIIFLYSWYQEDVKKRSYLYLVNYKLYVTGKSEINTNNPTRMIHESDSKSEFEDNHKRLDKYDQESNARLDGGGNMNIGLRLFIRFASYYFPPAVMLIGWFEVAQYGDKLWPSTFWKNWDYVCYPIGVIFALLYLRSFAWFRKEARKLKKLRQQHNTMPDRLENF